MAKIIYCNVCGQQIGAFDKHNCLSFSKVLGYGSKYDGEFIDIDICPHCFDKLIEKMVIKPFMD